MPERIETANEYGSGVVLNWASILDPNARAQAEMTSRSPIVTGHVALMPDAHLGMGATIGTVIETTGGIIPAAVGVDIGCGMIAVHFDFPYANLLKADERVLAACMREGIPNGVGTQHTRPTWRNEDWHAEHGYAPSMQPDGPLEHLRSRADLQFGTLGSGNHFAEFGVDEAGDVWAIVHSGSRGTGNAIAQHHIDIAKRFGLGAAENIDLAYLEAGTPEFDAYIADMEWAQKYAYGQRAAMMGVLIDAMALVVDPRYGAEVLETINCHHNYAEPLTPDRNVWLTRKGAIAAHRYDSGVIPGSMGTDTYIVRGLGNADSYNSAPHGAGRVHSRGSARRTLSVEDLRATMVGKTWDDRNAEALLDEAPAAYKPIEVVMADAADLVRPVARLRSFVNFKAADMRTKKKALPA